MNRYGTHWGWLTVVLGLIVGPAQSQELGSESSRSFAEAFFVSTRTLANGEQGVEWLGTGIIWLLLSASAVSLGAIVFFLWGTKREALIPTFSREQASRLLHSGGYRKAIKVLTEDQSFFGSVANTTLLTAPRGYEAMLMAMEDAVDQETARHLRKVDLLHLVGQLAPMAGLFGTVYGMILAFQSIVSAGGNADPVLLAGGIGTALVTTFWGLVVAIPALMGYAVVRNRILDASESVVAEVTVLIRPFDPEWRKAHGSGGKTKSTVDLAGAPLRSQPSTASGSHPKDGGSPSSPPQSH